MWRDGADGFKTAPPMGLLDYNIRIETVIERPSAPYTLNGRGRVDKYAVHVKENGSCGEDHSSG
jgi:hypothetical protein